MKLENKLSSKFSPVCLQFLLLVVKVYFERACKAVRLPGSLWDTWRIGFVRGWKVEFAPFQLWDWGLITFSDFWEEVSGSQAHCWNSAQGWRWSVKTNAVYPLLGIDVSRGEPVEQNQGPEEGVCLNLVPDALGPAPGTSASVCKGRNMLLRKVAPDSMGRCFGKKSNIRKLHDFLGRYTCYLTAIVNVILKMAGTGSSFTGLFLFLTLFLEEHGCTLYSKPCLFSFNKLWLTWMLVSNCFLELLKCLLPFKSNDYFRNKIPFPWNTSNSNFINS